MKNPAILADMRKHVVAGLRKAEIMKSMKISSAKFWELFALLTLQDNVVHKIDVESDSLRDMKISASGFTVTTARLKALGVADAFAAGKSLKTEVQDGKLIVSVMSAS